MKFVIYLLLFSALISCDKPDSLQPENLKKVLILKIDYRLNKFEGGKEFAYFKDDVNADTLQIFKDYIFTDQTARLILRYGSGLDTIFDGTEVTDGQGDVNYPTNFDNAIFYYKLDGYLLNKPDNSRFQVIHHNMSSSIPYDSIWKAVSNLQIVEEYQSKNSTVKIGLFLHRPSVVLPNPGDWKWYLIFKE